MAKLKIVDLGLYRLHVHVFVGSQTAFIEWLKGDSAIYQSLADYVEDDNAEAATYWYSAGRIPIIYLPKLSTTPHHLNNLVHELGHLVFIILNDVGIPISFDNQEAFTYLQGWLAEQIFNKEGYEEIEEPKNRHA